MAAYSYKDTISMIPSHYFQKFEKEFEVECDCDPGYDGDYWILAGMYIEDLEKSVKELTAKIEELGHGQED